MAKTYLRYAPDQTLLLPPNVREWLPNDHLALFVSDAVEMLDLSAIFAYYEEETRGAPPFHPGMMVRILVYGYCVGTRSSRRIAKATEDEIPFRVLAANNFPDFRTVSEFRRIHLDTLVDLFAQVLRVCQSNGFLKLGLVATDGTKMKANASLQKNKNRAAIEKEEDELHEKVKKILKEAQTIDEEEDRTYGPDKRGDELPEEWRSSKGRVGRLKEAKRQLDEEAKKEDDAHKKHLEERAQKEEQTGKKLRGRKPKAPDLKERAKATRNTTDPDSRIMKTMKGYVQGYNAQATVDIESGIVVAASVTQEANDMHQLNPNLHQIHENIGRYPDKLTADTGYWTEKEIMAAPPEVELFIATKKDHKQRAALANAKSPRGRIPDALSLRDRMTRKLQTIRGKAIYKKRGSSIEPVFGYTKSGRRIDSFLLRGNEKVDGEWKLINLGHNLLKMWRPQAG